MRHLGQSSWALSHWEIQLEQNKWPQVVLDGSSAGPRQIGHWRWTFAAMAVKMKQEQVSAMKKFILIIIFYHLFSPFIAFDEHMMLFLQYDFKI